MIGIHLRLNLNELVRPAPDRQTCILCRYSAINQLDELMCLFLFELAMPSCSRAAIGAVARVAVRGRGMRMFTVGARLRVSGVGRSPGR